MWSKHMRWKSLDKDRKYREMSDGLILIKPKKKTSVLPAHCPVCDVLFSSSLDLESYRNSECCSYCETKYAFIDRSSWLKGTRPTKDQLAADLKSRKLLGINIKF
jgi:hypothetical protein